MMARENDLWLIGLVVPEPQRVIFASAQKVRVVPGHCNMADRVRMTLEEAYFGNLEVAGVKGILGDEFVLRANQESAGLAADAGAAICDV